jgi:hypothetical protein
MTRSDTSLNVRLPARTYSPLAGLLSYLVPGLGQIYQGRVAKGILFLVVLYGLFFYGLALGGWQNVYLEPLNSPAGRVPQDQRLFQVVLDRVRFLGQVWIGVAAWPALIQWQHKTEHPFPHRTDEPNENQGADPAEEHPWLGKFERMPSYDELNNFLRNHDKGPDLGWVYTVVAGVLNILVIYDAFAGPAFRTAGRASRPVAHSSAAVPQID